MLRSSGPIAGGCFIALAAIACAADWPQFRGPGGAGLANESQLPIEWSGERNIRWKIDVPGVAWSSPVVWSDRVFLTTAITDNQPKPQPFGGGGGGRPGFGPPRGNRPDGDADAEDADRPPAEGARERPQGRGPGGRRGRAGGGFGRGGGQPPDAMYRFEVYCLDRATGNVLWKRLAVERKPTIPTQRANSYASETPVTDGKRVYAYFGMTGLFCFDIDGNPLWQKDLGSHPMQMGFGTGSSPVLGDDCLFVQCDNEAESFLVALDKMTGAERWRAAR